MIASIIIAAALSGASLNPCDVATRAEVRRVFGGGPIEFITTEELAPSCHWVDASRRQRIDLSIWSAAELSAIGMKDAATYFAKLRAAEGGAHEVDGIGDNTFDSWRLTVKGQAEGVIVVLKGERLFVFKFLGSLSVADVHAFVRRVITRS